jgi:excisionase family DNA binding protein
MDKANYYTVNEASVVLGRSVQTIYKWLHTEKIQGMRNPITGRYVILRSDVEDALKWV